MPGVTSAALLTLFPSPDHGEIGVGPYGHEVAPQALEAGELPTSAEGIEVMARRVFDTIDPDITGTGENLRLRLFRDAEGVVKLDALTYDSLLLTARVRPELGDQLDLGTAFGNWEEVWIARDNGRTQWRLFSPVGLTLLGFSNTDQDEDAKLKYYIGARGGFGGELLARVAGPVGLQFRTEGRARTQNRYRASEANTTRHELTASAELGLSYMNGRQAWVLGGWGEHVTQFEPRDDAGRDGVDRQYFAAGLRLSGRFYKDAPVAEAAGELAEADVDQVEELREARRAREEALAAEGGGDALAEGGPAPEDVAIEVAESDGPTLIHWSEMNLIKKVPAIYPEEAAGEGSCTVRLFVDDDGRPTDIRPVDCAEPWLRPAMQALWQWQFRPLEEDGQPIPVQFLYTVVFDAPAEMTSPG